MHAFDSMAGLTQVPHMTDDVFGMQHLDTSSFLAVGDLQHGAGTAFPEEPYGSNDYSKCALITLFYTQHFCSFVSHGCRQHNPAFLVIASLTSSDCIDLAIRLWHAYF